tara:strand:- start:771 stop:1184 length:414 start_codon:yes stop_codon:yes gene_type:complete
MEQRTKIITLASFVVEDKVEGFSDYIKKRFKIPKEKLFIYTSPQEEGKKIVTFRLFLRDGKKINTKSFFPTTIITHKKGECFYTINALNKLIEEELKGDTGNLNHKEYKIDWDSYQNKMLITKKNELTIIDIKRNFS